MSAFLVKWLVNIIALFVVIHTIAGVSIANSTVMIAAALMIGLLNTFLKPVLILLTLPITIASFGLFTLIINAFLFYLASKFVAGFTVANLWSAFWAALLFSAVSLMLNLLFTPNIVFKASKRFEAKPRHVHERCDDIIDVEGSVIHPNDNINQLKEDRK